MCYVVAIPRKPHPGAGLLRRSDLRRISRKRRLVFVNHVRQLKAQEAQNINRGENRDPDSYVLASFVFLGPFVALNASLPLCRSCD